MWLKYKLFILIIFHFIFQKVLIDGARLKESKSYIKDNSFVDLEVNIQEYTELVFFGKHEEPEKEAEPIQTCNFENILSAAGVLRKFFLNIFLLY